MEIMATKTINPAEVLPPRAAKRYEKLKLIGRGGMGEVYKARDALLRRTVAIKVIIPSGRSTRSKKERFRREVISLACVHHPNVVQVFHYDEEEDFLYLVMEYVRGRPLRRLIADGPLPLAQAVKITNQVADGLEAFHANGVYHRDITPANIMVDAAGKAKLMDFGCAGFGENWDMTRLTKTGHHVGTFAYMPPEVFRGEDWDVRSDVFQLGLVFYEILTGQQPRDATKLLKLTDPNAEIDIKPPSFHVGSVDEALDDLVLKALAFHRSDRTADVSTFSTQLLAWYSFYLRQATAKEEARLTQRVPVRLTEDGDIDPSSMPASLRAKAAQNVAARDKEAKAVNDDSMYGASDGDAPAQKPNKHKRFRRKSMSVRMPEKDRQALRNIRKKSLSSIRKRSRPPTMPSAAQEQIARHQIEVARMAWWRKRMTIGLFIIIFVGVSYRKASKYFQFDLFAYLSSLTGSPAATSAPLPTIRTTSRPTKNGAKGPSSNLSSKNSLADVKRAISGGSDVNQPRESGLLSLHLAVIRDQQDVAEVFLDGGGAVDATDKFGYAALHWAAFLGRLEMTRFLLDRGANINFGWKVTTPLHTALQGRETEMKRILRNAVKDIKLGSERARRKACVLVAIELLKRGADVNALDARRRTPLHLAASLADEKLLKSILQKGPEVNARDYQGETPLFNALRSRAPKRMVSCLLANGARAKTSTNMGTTPLALAKHLKLISVAAILQRAEKSE